MLRHSISQIFESSTLHEQLPEPNSAMFSALQTSRPKVPPSYSPLPPLNQQPAKTIASRPTPPTPPVPQPTPYYLPPRSQVEAMPPVAPVPTMLVLGRPQQQFLPALRHPVFFTDRFTKAPPGVTVGGNWENPVATGYVYNDGVKRPLEGSSRL